MDVIEVYAILNNLDRSKAIKELAKQYRLSYGKIDREAMEIEKKNEKMFIDFMEKCQNNPEFRKKYAFLEMRKRGFTKETIERFKIGLFDASIKKYMETTYSKGVLQQGGFINKRGNWTFSKRIVYPYLNQNNKPEYFIYRLIDSDPDFNKDAKYVKQYKTKYVKEIPFGLNSIYLLKNKPLIITEGITDAMSVIQANYPCLSPVTVRIKENDIEKMVTYCKRFNKVVVINDNEEFKKNKEGELDNSGLKGGIDTLKVLIKHDIDCSIGIIPNPEKLEKIDLDDYLKPNLVGLENREVNRVIKESLKLQGNKIEELVNNSIPGFDSFISLINEESNQSELNEIFDLLPEKDIILRGRLFRELSKKTKLKPNEIRELFEQRKEKKSQKENESDYESYEIAKKILEDFNIFCPKEFKNIVLVYKGGVYREESEVFLDKIILNFFVVNKINEDTSDSGLITKLNIIKKYIKGEAYCSIREFNRYDKLINVKNGLLDISDLNNFNFLPHDPKYKITIQIPTNFKPKAKCEKLQKCIREHAGIDNEDVIYEAWGNTLLGNPNKFQKFIIFFGEGSTGKSTTLNMLKKLLGNYNCSSESLQDLIYSDFAGANLEHKLANIHGDLPDKYLKRSGILKILTGEEDIIINRKYGKRYKSKITAMMFYSCNKIPITYDNSTAFYRRVILIQFTKVILEGDRIDDYLDKIINEEELSGLLNLALNGLKNLCKRGHYDPKYSENVQETWEKYSEPLVQFFDRYCEFEKDDNEFMIEKKDLLFVYNKFLKSLKFPEVPNTVKLSKEVNRLKGYEIGTKRKQSGGVLYYYYTGLIFNDKASEDFEIKEKQSKTPNKLLDHLLQLGGKKNQLNKKYSIEIYEKIESLFKKNNYENLNIEYILINLKSDYIEDIILDSINQLVKQKIYKKNLEDQLTYIDLKLDEL